MFIDPAPRDAFFDYWECTDNIPYIGGFSHLQDYVLSWGLAGEAVSACGGDFGDYMTAVVLIYAKYAKHPASLDYRPHDGPRVKRRPSGHVALGRSSVECFTRLWWSRLVLSETRRSAVCRWSNDV